jgi:5-hydroxyisourate hydrolase-like protein (transthyretin family)
MKLSVQVVDCAFGVAADNVRICLSRRVKSDWCRVAEGRTDSAGTLREWHNDTLPAGTYQLEVNLDAYYADMGITPFVQRAIVEFDLTDTAADLLIPLLVTGNSFFVYRSVPPMTAGT